MEKPGAMLRTGTRMLAAIVLIVLATTPAALAQAVLSADVIKQSFGGNTAEIVGQSNTIFVFYSPDGTQRMQNQAGQDNGTWRISPEGEFCGKWVKLRNGAEVCAPVIDLGGGLYQWGNSKFRLLLGNPKGL
jgi:hypothetical protein